MENVVILGASSKPDRYSYQALKLLQEHGHKVIPVHPNEKEVEGIQCLPTLKDITEPVDTVTLYVNPTILAKQIDDLIALKPRRVIFNPGTENLELQHQLQNNQIKWEEACTLVLLRTGQF